MMPFLVISKKSYFSLFKQKEFLSCPNWRSFVLNRGVYRCAKAGLQFYQFQQSTGRTDAKFVHSGTYDRSTAFQLCIALLCFLLHIGVLPAAPYSRVVFRTILQRKCQPIKQLPCNVHYRKQSVGVNKCCLSASAVLYSQFSSKQEPNVNDTWVIFS